MYGIKPTGGTEGDNLEIHGIVLSTSSVKGDPHSLKTKLRLRDGRLKIEEASCSCKAGLSEACKHMVALLLQVNKVGIDNVGFVSQTDIECTWKAKPGKSIYREVIPVK